MSLSVGKAILLPHDETLLETLRGLGIRTTEEKGSVVLTEVACQEAGVDFRFFESFAQLRKQDSTESPTALLRRQLRDDSYLTDFKIPSLREAWQREFDGLKWETHDHWRRFENLEIAVPKLFEPHRPLLQSQAAEDHQEVDSEEAQVLAAVLGRLMVTRETGVTPRLVRDRINALAAEPCWLSGEGLRVGLLGAVNGTVPPTLTYNYLLGRQTSEAAEVSCRMPPAMEELSNGLFFDPKKFPMSGVRRAARATIGLEDIEGKSRGSGVVMFKPGYVVTAWHVAGVFLDNIEGGRVRLKVKVGGVTREVRAEIVATNLHQGERKSDLAVFYIPELVGLARPLPISRTVKPLQPPDQKRAEGSIDPEAQEWMRRLLREMSREMGENGSRFGTENRTKRILPRERFMPDMIPDEFDSNRLTYPAEPVYAIGVPFQKEPNDLLVTPGRIDSAATRWSGHGLVVSTAVGLPGLSGGPQVDRDGGVVGITTELVFSEGLLEDRLLFVDFDRGVMNERIIGSKFYPMAEWGAAIEREIAAHQRLKK